jgi:hypothetical protein
MDDQDQTDIISMPNDNVGGNSAEEKALSNPRATVSASSVKTDMERA